MASIMALKKMKVNTTMSRLHPRDLKLGDVFYECEQGLNLKVTVSEAPICELEDGYEKWSWKATRINGSTVDYFWHSKHTAYAPKIYSQPEYFRAEKDENGEMKITTPVI